MRYLLSVTILGSIRMFVIMGWFWSITSAEAAVIPQFPQGMVEILLKGEHHWKPLSDTIQLNAGDHIRTGAAGEVDLWCEDGSGVHLGPETQVTINELQFSEDQKTRIFRFKLLQGTITVDVVEHDFTQFKFTKQSLEHLKSEDIPDDISEGLKSLENQEFTEEHTFLNAVKKCIGGAQTVAYKKLILEHADSRRNVFEIATEGLLS